MSPRALESSTEAGRGLTDEQARRLLAEVGPNEIAHARGPSPWSLLAGQFKSPLIWLLFAAAAISGFLREVVDAVAIALILVINAVVGFLQEYRAEKAVAALRSITAPRARVVRDGGALVVPASTIVPGDVLVLEAGDLVAADARLLEAHRLTTNEALLTGESVPVEKSTAPAPADAPLAERTDRIFMGTAVSTGTGRAAVIATGMKTELGRIAGLLAETKSGETPLQRRLAQVSRSLLLLCLAIVAAVALLGLARGVPALDVFMSAVSLAVAAVPEGLPAVVTIALAVGVQRMAARNVLVRRLPAVETLGCVTVICTDKTGTLTTGKMTVRELWGPDHQALLAAAAACCDAELSPDGRTGTGDPTEVAILLAAAGRGISRPEIEASNPRLAVEPFDPVRKRMSIRRRDGRLYVKGGIEAIADRSVADPAGALAQARDLAARGLRVLAVAVGEGAAEERLQILGLIGMADPPRTEATEAVAAARGAGIRTVMITGDHPATATAIAREMGIVRPGEDAAELVHARAAPEDKLTTVRAWKARGDVVAMTGDGVNDAPALREAHVGIAMGRGGTEVTREAAHIVLADDNFASIVSGVREGRGIFDNIRKSLLYLLSGNAGELAVMLGAAAVGLPMPVLPLQILWINLVTDGFPALALVRDRPDRDILDRPPRRPDERILGRSEWILIVLIGLAHAAITMGVFVWALRHRGIVAARTWAFSTLVFGQVFLSFAFRSRARVLWEVGPFRNVALVLVVAGTAVLQVGLLSLPAAARVFQLATPSLASVVVPVLLGLIPVTLVESAKLIRRLTPPARGPAA
jgi:Ca2+-transporting ATPase